MIIAILVPIVVAGACLAEMARRAYLGRRMVSDMESYEPLSTIRILRTAEELQGALRRVSEAERLKARQANRRADHYVAVADSVTGAGVTILAIPPGAATA